MQTSGMANIADRILGWLLLIGGVLHGLGSVSSYDFGSPILFWALAGSLAAMLLAALNLMRHARSCGIQPARRHAHAVMHAFHKRCSQAETTLSRRSAIDYLPRLITICLPTLIFGEKQ